MHTVLGINCAHDAAVCMVADDTLAVAIPEERLTRAKYQSGFPTNALHECLRTAHIDGSNIDCVVINQLPPARFERLLQGIVDLRHTKILVNPSHHLLHACYAFAHCGADTAACLVVDGSGYSYGEYLRRGSSLLGPPPPYEECHEAWSMFCVGGGELSVVGRGWELWEDDKSGYYCFPSLGHMYSVAAQYIFGTWTAAGKVMGLAALGDPRRLGFEIVGLRPDGVSVDTSWVYGLPSLRGCSLPYMSSDALDVAALVQSEVERGVLHLAQLLKSRAPDKDTLCMTGGVALNTLTNTRVFGESGFSGVSVTPAAGDAGTAIGAAAYGNYVLRGRLPSLGGYGEFFGRKCSEESIRVALCETNGIACEERASGVLAEEMALEISLGRVVALFEGRAEFGPRALGHRSILADARKPTIKDVLNASIKHREAYRPYACSVLEEHVHSWFDIPCVSPHMLFVGLVRSDKRHAIPGVVHADGSSRIQTVGRSYPGMLRAVLEEFYRLTKVPMILNTSMNVQSEPICESPHDALQLLLATDLDVLYLERFRVTRRSSSA